MGRGMHPQWPEDVGPRRGGTGTSPPPAHRCPGLALHQTHSSPSVLLLKQRAGVPFGGMRSGDMARWRPGPPPGGGAPAALNCAAALIASRSSGLASPRNSTLVAITALNALTTTQEEEVQRDRRCGIRLEKAWTPGGTGGAQAPTLTALHCHHASTAHHLQPGDGLAVLSASLAWAPGRCCHLPSQCSAVG